MKIDIGWINRPDWLDIYILDQHNVRFTPRKRTKLLGVDFGSF